MSEPSYTQRIRRGDVAPFVGEGADGARRSAQILRDEIYTLPHFDPRRGGLEAQAQAWDDRAMVLEAEDRA